MPEDIQSRFTVYPRPDANPGRCIVCGATQRPVVDFGVDIEWADLGFGRAYFCVTCIKQAASKFPDDEIQEDWISPERFAEALADQKVALYDGLRDYLNRFSPAVDAVPVYGSPDSVPEQAESDDTQGSGSDKSEPSEFAFQTNIFASGKGPLSVSSDNSDGSSGSFLGL